MWWGSKVWRVVVAKQIHTRAAKIKAQLAPLFLPKRLFVVIMQHYL
jgi:hypothetical protein